MAAILLFDTLKFSKRLIQAGMPSLQAEELAEAQKEALEESLSNGIASKEDIAVLDKKIDKLNEKLDLKFGKLANKLYAHDWMLRFLLGISAAILIKLFI